MLFKSSKKLDAHIFTIITNSLGEESIKITSGKNTKGMVMMKLANTPLSFLYGWDKESDYWILSDN